MQLDLDDEEAAALLGELNNIIENDRYPLSARIRVLRGIRAKFGPMALDTATARQASDTGRARPEAPAALRSATKVNLVDVSEANGRSS